MGLKAIGAWRRLYYTLRYYRRKQVMHRLWRSIRRPTLRAEWNQCRGLTNLPVRKAPLQLLSLVAEGVRLYLSAEKFDLELLGFRRFGEVFDWGKLEASIASRLGRFQFHYHEFLENASVQVGDSSPSVAVWRILDSWLEKYNCAAMVAGDAWHPYVVSRRIPVWIKLLLKYSPDRQLEGRILHSLATQVRWLRRNLELDLGGNHLLQNLRALALGAAFFEGDEAGEWLETVRRYLLRELAEQILRHGEHFERAPAYHVDMLIALADIYLAAGAAGASWAEEVKEPVSRMAEFLRKILHPDGQIPLFGDSSFDQIAHPQKVLEELGFPGAVPRPEKATSEILGEYWIFREKDNFLIFDAGPVGPDHLPAHAHADLLTLEASWSGRRLIVDAGVFDYEDSPERAYCRSTAAHNTLEIDGENQCDVWSRFRMGRRGWPGKLLAGVDGAFHWAHCTHNAYRHLGVREVKRVVVVSEQGGIVILDFAKGRGRHLLCSRIRIDGSWVVTQEGASFVRVQNGSAVLKITTVGRDLPIKIKRADYYPLFGQRSFAWELSITLETDLPAAAGWLIMPVAAGDVKLDWEEGAVLVVRDACADRVRIPGL